MSGNYGKGPIVAEGTVSSPFKFFCCDFCVDQGTPPPGRPSGYTRYEERAGRVGVY